MGLLSSFKNTIKNSLASIKAGGVTQNLIDPALQQRLQSTGQTAVLSNLQNPASLGMNYTTKNPTVNQRLTVLSKPQTQAAAAVPSKTVIKPVVPVKEKVNLDATGGGYTGNNNGVNLGGASGGSNENLGGVGGGTGGTGENGGVDSTGGTGGTGGQEQPQKSALEKLMEQYITSLQPTAEETATQKQLNDIIAQQAALNASLTAGKENVSQQTIPMDFITGQQAGLERQASARQQALGAQSVPLTQQLALLQAQRQGQQAATKAGIELATPTYKDIASGASLVKLNPLTGQYETVAQGAGAGAAAPTVKDINGVSSQWNPTTGQWEAIATTTGITSQKLEQTQKALDLVKELKESSSLGRAVGPISSMLPTITGGSADFMTRLNSLKALLTLDNMKLMKGVLSDSDMKKIEQASTSLSEKMSEEGFKKELSKIETTLNNALSGAGSQNTEGVDWANI